MGQKIDARIFRQGVNKRNWEFKYIEKNKEDSSLFLYKTLEIQKYLNRFFGLYKIKIHNCKIFFSDSSLQIFISFYVTTRTFYAIGKNITKYSKKCTAIFKPAFSNRRKKVKNHKLRKIATKGVEAFAKNQSKKKKRIYNSERVILNNNNRMRKIRNFEIKKNQKILIKKNVSWMKFKQYSATNLKEFHQILMKSLKAYTKNKICVSVTLQNLNRFKNLSHIQMKGLKQIFKQLRNFVKNSFFKEAINILFVSISKRKSAKILAEFMSDQFRLNQLRTDQVTISRKDNYFMGFLKQTVMLLIKSEISCVMGVKIVVKGRFNRAPRARINHIRFGKFSLQSFNSKINYHQSTAYTVNGTFGVKIWLCENDH
jgi:ribosomal protein S3